MQPIIAISSLILQCSNSLYKILFNIPSHGAKISVVILKVSICTKGSSFLTIKMGV